MLRKRRGILHHPDARKTGMRRGPRFDCVAAPDRKTVRRKNRAATPLRMTAIEDGVEFVQTQSRGHYAQNDNVGRLT